MKNISELEWNFKDCPHSEIRYCWQYEYARSSKPLVQEALQAIPKRSQKTYEDLEGYYGHFDYFYLSWPEWPDLPYLAIPINKREARIKRAETYLEYSHRTFHSSWRSDPSGFKFFKGAIDRWNRWLEEVIWLKPDWNKSDAELLQEFAELLKEERPQGSRKTKYMGAGAPVRQLKTDLKALGAYRLDQVGVHHSDCTLYANQPRYIEARERAKELLSKFC